MKDFLYYFTIFLIWYFLVLNSIYIYLLIAAIPDVLRKFREAILGNIGFLTRSPLLPTITAIVPAYNEEKSILQTIDSLLNVDYHDFKIIIVDDGSTDETLNKLIYHYQLQEITPIIPKKIPTESAIKKYYESKIHPNLNIISKEHSGKSDSLNWGINAARSPFFVTIDADSIIEPTAINLLCFSLMSESHVIAQGGAVFVMNGCKIENGKILEANISFQPLVSLQTCEYLRAFYYGRSGWKEYGGSLILSGAITFFERQAVIEVGGFKLDAPGEDMEIILRLHKYMTENKYPYKIYYSPVPAIWTHVPENLTSLWRQRSRWQAGEMDSLFSHITMLFNPRYGSIGFLSFPFHLFGEFLGPLVEFVGYIVLILVIYFNIINWYIALLFFLACWGLEILLTMGVTLINLVSFNKYQSPLQTLWLFIVAIFEIFGFRQYLTICRTYATFKHLFKMIFSHKKKKTDDKKHPDDKAKAIA